MFSGMLDVPADGFRRQPSADREIFNESRRSASSANGMRSAAVELAPTR
jgi:hypothetical protein